MESSSGLLRDEPELEEVRESLRPPVVAAREERSAFPVTKWETIGIFLFFGVVYTLLGFKVVADQHVVNFDALDRLTRAFMVWYNDPPKLAAIGFSSPPIAGFMLVPFAAIKGLVTSPLALPLSSAIFAAGALTFFNRMFAIADMARVPRLIIVLLIAINPMFVFYAINGTGDAAYMMFGALGLFSLIGWGRSGSARYLIGAGLAFSLAVLTKYEFIPWAFFIAFLISWTLTNRGRSKDEIEGSTIAYLAPIGYALGIWIFLNALVLGDPFGWISLAGNAAPVNAVAGVAPGFDVADAIGNILRIQLVFPATLLVVPLLLLNLGGSRDTMSIGFATLILISLAYSFFGAAVDGSTNVIELRDALAAMLAGIAGFAWLYLRSPDMRRVIGGLLIALSIIALPTAWSQMKGYPHQNLEQAFTRAIATGDDQEGTTSRGGFQVGVGPEQAMARFIEDQQIPENEILTDNARTYGVISLTGQPELFLDRISRGEEEWDAALLNPTGRVEFMLVERTDSDLILEQYPGAVEGGVPFLESVVANDRYALLRVMEGVGTSQGAGGTAGSPSTVPDQPGPIGSAPPVIQGPPPGVER